MLKNAPQAKSKVEKPKELDKLQELVDDARKTLGLLDSYPAQAEGMIKKISKTLNIDCKDRYKTVNAEIKDFQAAIRSCDEALGDAETLEKALGKALKAIEAYEPESRDEKDLIKDATLFRKALVSSIGTAMKTFKACGTELGGLEAATDDWAKKDAKLASAADVILAQGSQALDDIAGDADIIDSQIGLLEQNFKDNVPGQFIKSAMLVMSKQITDSFPRISNTKKALEKIEALLENADDAYEQSTRAAIAKSKELRGKLVEKLKELIPVVKMAQLMLQKYQVQLKDLA